MQQILKGLWFEQAPFVQDLAHPDKVRRDDLVPRFVAPEQKPGIRGDMLEQHLRATDFFPDEAESLKHLLEGGERDGTILHG